MELYASIVAASAAAGSGGIAAVLNPITSSADISAIATLCASTGDASICTSLLLSPWYASYVHHAGQVVTLEHPLFTLHSRFLQQQPATLSELDMWQPVMEGLIALSPGGFTRLPQAKGINMLHVLTLHNFHAHAISTSLSRLVNGRTDYNGETPVHFLVHAVSSLRKLGDASAERSLQLQRAIDTLTLCIANGADLTVRDKWVCCVCVESLRECHINECLLLRIRRMHLRYTLHVQSWYILSSLHLFGAYSKRMMHQAYVTFWTPKQNK